MVIFLYPVDQIFIFYNEFSPVIIIIYATIHITDIAFVASSILHISLIFFNIAT
jgi:hypothetical protein